MHHSKTMKRYLSLAICLIALYGFITVPLVTGCRTQTPQQVAYKTIYSVQSTTVAAYDEYIANVIAGRVPTNGVPDVSKAFNSFQAATLVALDGAQWNTNAPVTSQVSQLSADLLLLIANLSRK